MGKSLGNILDDYFGSEAPEIGDSSVVNNSQPYTASIPIQEIEMNPWQTRTEFDEEKIQKLAKDIDQNGLIQPILVVANKPVNFSSKRFRLLAGERRLRAHIALGREEILATVRPVGSLDASQQAFISAMENLQREDLNPMDLASTYQMLIETQNISPAELADKIAVSTQYIKNYIRLLSLTPEVKGALKMRQIGEGQARYLVNLEPERQVEILQKIIQNKLTVKEIIALLGNKKSVKVKILKPQQHSLPPEVVSKVTRIAQDFPGAKIKFTGNQKTGKITISWKTKK